MSKINDFIKIALNILQNIPSIVLDTREAKVTSEHSYFRKLPYKTSSADFEVSIKIDSKVTQDKDYKIIIFISDI